MKGAADDALHRSTSGSNSKDKDPKQGPPSSRTRSAGKSKSTLAAQASKPKRARTSHKGSSRSAKGDDLPQQELIDSKPSLDQQAAAPPENTQPPTSHNASPRHADLIDEDIVLPEVERETLQIHQGFYHGKNYMVIKASLLLCPPPPPPPPPPTPPSPKVNACTPTQHTWLSLSFREGW